VVRETDEDVIDPVPVPVRLVDGRRGSGPADRGVDEKRRAGDGVPGGTAGEPYGGQDPGRPGAVRCRAAHGVQEALRGGAAQGGVRAVEAVGDRRAFGPCGVAALAGTADGDGGGLDRLDAAAGGGDGGRDRRRDGGGLGQRHDRGRGLRRDAGLVRGDLRGGVAEHTEVFAEHLGDREDRRRKQARLVGDAAHTRLQHDDAGTDVPRVQKTGEREQPARRQISIMPGRQ
jgi:hypothetical protein